jgi:WXG100 family type VII secretion target
MFDEAGGGGGLMQSDTELLTSGAIEAGTTAEGLDGLLRGLMERLSPLMTEWLGEGGGAFQRVREEFGIEMDKLNRALTSIGEDMGLSSTDYVNADDMMRSDLIAAGASSEQVSTLLAGLEG